MRKMNISLSKDELKTIFAENAIFLPNKKKIRFCRLRKSVNMNNEIKRKRKRKI